MSHPHDPSGPQHPPYGDPAGGQPPYGGPTGGQPPYGGPPGPPPGGQPPYGDPMGGQPPYGMPPGSPYGPPPGGPSPYGPPPKKGMSTGAKIGIGVGGCFGLVIIAIVVVVIVAALSVSGDDTSSSPTSYATEEEVPQEEGAAEEAPAAGEQAVSMTASAAGTAGDVIDDTVYTVLDVELTNNGDEDLSVSPMYFTAVLADGTERTDWGEALFADITPFEITTLTPGSSATGQIAVVGEVEVAEVRYDPSFGMEEPIVAVVE